MIARCGLGRLIPWLRDHNGNGGIRHLLPPDYHGNPIDLASSLVITEWGDEVFDFIFRSSGMTTTVFNLYDPRSGLREESLDVLISRKASAANLIFRPDGDPADRIA